MKRFHIFCFDTFYPSGGASDFYGASDSIDEAKALGEKTCKEKELRNFQVFDCETLSIIFEG